MNAPTIKRFYKDVNIVSGEAGYAVLLDDKEVRTPLRKPLVVPVQKLAEAIAAEWQAQDEVIKPDTMPLTSLMNVAIDKAEDGSKTRAEMTQNILNYAGTDLVCYFASHPEDLVQKQQELWQPILDWLRKDCGIALQVTSDIQHVAQPANALADIEGMIADMSPLAFSALQALVGCTGSFVIAYAVLKGHLDSDSALQAAFLDEIYQAGKWGMDEEQQNRQKNTHAELIEIQEFIALIAG